MRCFICEALSIKPICKNCSKRLFTPNITIKKIGNLEVVSLFDYEQISDFIKSKYYANGYRIYKYLA